MGSLQPGCTQALLQDTQMVSSASSKLVLAPGSCSKR